MRPTLVCSLLALSCGCAAPPAEPPAEPPAAPGDNRPAGPQADPDGIRLPHALYAKPIEPVEYSIYLNVDRKGRVLFAPNQRPRDSTGEEIAVLDSPEMVWALMRRRADEDCLAAGPGGRAGAEQP